MHEQNIQFGRNFLKVRNPITQESATDLFKFIEICSVMPERGKGCDTSLDHLSFEELESRSIVASELASDAYQCEILSNIPFTKGAYGRAGYYLSLVADVARNESSRRKVGQTLDQLVKLFSAVENALHDKPEDGALGTKRAEYIADIKSAASKLNVLISKLDFYLSRLALLDPAKTNDDLTTCRLPPDHSLRPPLPDSPNGYSIVADKKKKFENAKLFRLFSARTWLKLKEQFNNKVPIEALEAFATECDARGFTPVSPFLPDEVCIVIQGYNTMHKKAPIRTFSILLAKLMQVSASLDLSEKDDKAMISSIRSSFRSWLSGNAARQKKLW
jgi:hypothetical protein